MFAVQDLPGDEGRVGEHRESGRASVLVRGCRLVVIPALVRRYWVVGRTVPMVVHGGFLPAWEEDCKKPAMFINYLLINWLCL
jgi:hypothetical protein